VEGFINTMRYTEQIVNKQKILRYLLAPLTWVYSRVVDIRNWLYTKEILKAIQPKQFSIVVGNITVGGTGKTPMIEYLVQLLVRDNQLVILSRGYGRHTRGFQLATPQSTAESIGDEPLQYYEKFGNECKIAVSESRVAGARTLAELFPDHSLMLLDDAFQHRALRANINIVLNDYNRPFYEDVPFPGGRLREPRYGARRADAIITTKCPDGLSEDKKRLIRQRLMPYLKAGTPCFFAGVRYGVFRPASGYGTIENPVIVVAGIARPDDFIRHMEKLYSVSGVRTYPDHYSYRRADLDNLLKMAKNEEMIVTTEKDIVKLRPLALQTGCLHRLGYIPIEVDLGQDSPTFREWLSRTMTERQPPLNKFT
jgi:tetraacyldisaccharide 4'-kinase